MTPKETKDDKPKIKLEFGNEVAIELLNIEKKYANRKTIEHEECDCNCPHCDHEYQKCPYCHNYDDDQFIDDEICKDCGKKVVPYGVKYRIATLKAKLLTPSK